MRNIQSKWKLHGLVDKFNKPIEMARMSFRLFNFIFIWFLVDFNEDVIDFIKNASAVIDHLIKTKPES